MYEITILYQMKPHEKYPTFDRLYHYVFDEFY